MSRGEKERKRKSSASGSTTKDAIIKGTRVLHKKKCAGERDKVL